ncbi:MAG: LacI family DNA-binding transcriptional regulator [Bacteroidia bacterium]|nr:LacI family DNA-binding transcriptional regulator [Bacteroidia bacterium]
MTKKVSLADVAESLGLSKTVVSMVINGKADGYGISKVTKQRVLQRIDEMNYRPNALAQGFRTGKSHTIGLLVSDISNGFYSRIARKLEDLAWQNGYNMVICSTDEQVDKELQQIEFLLDRHVDGLIISSSQTDAGYFNQLVDTGIPHVLIDRSFPGMKSPGITVDNANGARLAARHLISQGCRDFLVLANSPVHMSSMDERILGFREVLSGEGIPLPPEKLVVVPFNQVEETVRGHLDSCRQTGRMPDAIFGLNNIITIEVMNQLKNLSVSIPEEVAVISFDDMFFFSLTQPTISAVEQPIRQLTEQAFALLIQQMNKLNPGDPIHVQLPVSLIIRGSSVRKHP